MSHTSPRSQSRSWSWTRPSAASSRAASAAAAAASALASRSLASRAARRRASSRSFLRRRTGMYARYSAPVTSMSARPTKTIIIA
eukprot:scaffold75216_cov28-Tisochrysis_lutea.AAC.4